VAKEGDACTLPNTEGPWLGLLVFFVFWFAAAGIGGAMPALA
jgi:hypothetical protein